MSTATAPMHSTPYRPSRSEWWWQPRMMLPVILLVALVIRLWNIDQPRMSADESLHYFVEMQQIHLLPFEQQRRHPVDLYHATSPNPIGHPLFAVQLTNFLMQLFGPTESVARGIMGVAGVALVGVIYLLGRDMFDQRYGLLAALLAALVPLAVRYNRTLYLDSIYSLLIAFLVWTLLHAYMSRKLSWFLLSGVTLGLAAATKTSAPFLAVLIVGYGAFWWWQTRHENTPSGQRDRKARKRRRGAGRDMLPLWAKTLIVLAIGAVVFYVFVDPVAYLTAIRNPVDRSYQNRDALDYLVLMWTTRDWLGGVALYLWTPPLLLAAAAGLVLMIWKEWRKPSHVLVLMLLWLFCQAPLIPLHLRGLSGEHGYLSFVAPVTLLASVGLLHLSRWRLVAAVVVVCAVMLPATILFGHRLMLLPYNSYLNGVDSEASLSLPGTLPQSPAWALPSAKQFPDLVMRAERRQDVAAA